MLVSLLAGAVFACGDEPGPPGTGGGGAGGMAPTWTLVHDKLPGALLSVWGTSESDVWTVGGDARDGTGPLVLHYDGTAWSRVETGLTAGDLRAAFAQLNPGIPASSIGLLVSNGGWLREVRVCYSAAMRPAACSKRTFGPKNAVPLKIWRGL